MSQTVNTIIFVFPFCRLKVLCLLTATEHSKLRRFTLNPMTVTSTDSPCQKIVHLICKQANTSLSGIIHCNFFSFFGKRRHFLWFPRHQINHPKFVEKPSVEAFWHNLKEFFDRWKQKTVAITRQYTPISRRKERGFFDVVIKVGKGVQFVLRVCCRTQCQKLFVLFLANRIRVPFSLQLYENGAMSQCVRTWRVGDLIEWRGFFGSFTYKPNTVSEKILYPKTKAQHREKTGNCLLGVWKKKTISVEITQASSSSQCGAAVGLLFQFRTVMMLAAGTGIAPMISVIREIVDNDCDETFIHLIYACKRYHDILCKAQLDDFQQFWNFRCTYVLSQVRRRHVVHTHICQQSCPSTNASLRGLNYLQGTVCDIFCFMPWMHVLHTHTQTCRHSRACCFVADVCASSIEYAIVQDCTLALWDTLQRKNMILFSIVSGSGTRQARCPVWRQSSLWSDRRGVCPSEPDQSRNNVGAHLWD